MNCQAMELYSTMDVSMLDMQKGLVGILLKELLNCQLEGVSW